MPRRAKPHPLAKAIGRRIRELRLEAGLTLEKLAYESELGSKGYLSDIESGLALPSLKTLAVLADHLGLLLLDLVTFPAESERQQFIDHTRGLSSAGIRRLFKETASGER